MPSNEPKGGIQETFSTLRASFTLLPFLTDTKQISSEEGSVV